MQDTRSSTRIPTRELRRAAPSFRPLSCYPTIDLFSLPGRSICRSNTLKRLIPLPTIGASIDSPAHISRFAPFANDSLALAIFPGTTAFYRCVVVGRESDRPSYHDASGSGSKRRAVSRKEPEMKQRYLVRFDDDEDRIRPIEVSDIAEWPGGQHGWSLAFPMPLRAVDLTAYRRRRVTKSTLSPIKR
jgi:hypothetical protein